MEGGEGHSHRNIAILRPLFQPASSRSKVRRQRHKRSRGNKQAGFALDPGKQMSIIDDGGRAEFLEVMNTKLYSTPKTLASPISKWQ